MPKRPVTRWGVKTDRCRASFGVSVFGFGLSEDSDNARPLALSRLPDGTGCLHTFCLPGGLLSDVAPWQADGKAEQQWHTVVYVP